MFIGYSVTFQLVQLWLPWAYAIISQSLVRQYFQPTTRSAFANRVGLHLSLCRLLKMALLHLTNHVTTCRRLDGAATYALSQLFAAFTASWTRAEEVKREREAEEESLYRYRDRLHGDDEAEEAADDRQRTQMFPTYDQVGWHSTNNNNGNNKGTTFD